MEYKIVEKNNHLAIHGIFGSFEGAKNHLKNNIPVYCAKGFFVNKALKPESFEIIKHSYITGTKK